MIKFSAKNLFLLIIIFKLLFGSVYAYSPNPYSPNYIGQCTWYAYDKWPQISQPPPSTGNAYEWIIDARNKGYSTGRIPQVGAIAVWDVWNSTTGKYGHVAYVEEVSSDTYFKVSEYNWSVSLGHDTRWVTLDSRINFIYPQGTAPSGWVSVSALSVSPSTVVLGQDFNISFTLKERNGASKTLEKVAVAILDSNGTYLFDARIFDGPITITADGTWPQTVTTSLYISRPPGTYKVMIRGMLSGNWFDFDTTGSGHNPVSFSAITQPTDTTNPTINSFTATPSTVQQGSSFTISYNVSDSGGSGLKQVELYRANDSGGVPGTWALRKTNSISGNGPVSGSFTDAPSPAGNYWYGIHVVDNAGNWVSETSSIKVTVTPPNNPPTGWLDSASCDSISGWARDPDTTSPIDVHVYSDGAFVTSASANALRSDLPFTDKYHGYNIATPASLKNGQAHSINIYAIDSAGGNNPLLSGSPKSITCAPPVGHVSVSSLSISPTSVVIGQNFNASVTLKEVNGTVKTFEQIAIAILKSDGSNLFDAGLYNNITIPANGTWSQTATNSILATNPAGTYKVIVRGKLAGGNWFDFDTTGSGVNPLNFTAVEQTHNLNVTVTGSGVGSINSDPSGFISCTYPPQAGTCTTTRAASASLTLLASPDNYSIFSGWGNQCSTCSGISCLVEFESDKNCTATFTAAPKARVGTKEFSSLQAAYEDTGTQNDSIIKLLEGSQTGCLTADREINLTVEGGYKSDYVGNSANTTIYGNILIKAGSVSFESVIVGPQPAVHIPGDLNNDGIVDLYDYNILHANYGQTDCGNPADINGDCIVDAYDYNILHANYGKTICDYL
jgi:surface antigen